jgi:rhodanese-related sulfurtransferase
MRFIPWRFERNEESWNMPRTVESLLSWNYGEREENCELESVISQEAFSQLLLLPESEVLILDVRNRDEQPRVNEFPVTEIPLNELGDFPEKLQERKWNVIVCATGSRSLQAASMLLESGSNTRWLSLQGGLKAFYNQNRATGSWLVST